MLSNIELATAFGAIPRAVSVTTASGTEHWHGIEFVVNPNGTQFEFDHILIVYRETEAHTALMVHFGSDGSPTLAILEVADTMVSVPYTLLGSSGANSSATAARLLRRSPTRLSDLICSGAVPRRRSPLRSRSTRTLYQGSIPH